MSKKIIGITVGTPTSASRIADEIKPVKTVNGIFPDENGDVEVRLGLSEEQNAMLESLVSLEERVEQYADDANRYAKDADGYASYSESQARRAEEAANEAQGNADFVDEQTEKADEAATRAEKAANDANVWARNADSSALSSESAATRAEAAAQRAEDAANNAGGSGATGLPDVTTEDEGKVLMVSDGEWAVKELPRYDGEYSITPSASEDITLMTGQKMLDANIKINKIPYSEAPNDSNGTTVTIG